MQSAPLNLVYFADPMCSWCYGFAPELMRVVDSQSRDRAVKLDLVMGGLRAYQSAPLDGAQREAILGHWRHVAETTGLPFANTTSLAEGYVYDTEPACRAVVTARHLNPPASLLLLHAIQRAYYAEGRDTMQADVLLDIAIGCGFSGATFSEAFASQAMKEATRDDIALTQRVGVTGFPTLCVDADGSLLLINAGFVRAGQVETGLARLEEAPET